MRLCHTDFVSSGSMWHTEQGRRVRHWCAVLVSKVRAVLRYNCATNTVLMMNIRFGGIVCAPWFFTQSQITCVGFLVLSLHCMLCELLRCLMWSVTVWGGLSLSASVANFLAAEVRLCWCQVDGLCESVCVKCGQEDQPSSSWSSWIILFYFSARIYFSFCGSAFLYWSGRAFMHWKRVETPQVHLEPMLVYLQPQRQRRKQLNLKMQPKMQQSVEPQHVAATAVYSPLCLFRNL